VELLMTENSMPPLARWGLPQLSQPEIEGSTEASVSTSDWAGNQISERQPEWNYLLVQAIKLLEISDEKTEEDAIFHIKLAVIVYQASSRLEDDHPRPGNVRARLNKIRNSADDLKNNFLNIDLISLKCLQNTSLLDVSAGSASNFDGIARNRGCPLISWLDDAIRMIDIAIDKLPSDKGGPLPATWRKSPKQAIVDEALAIFNEYRPGVAKNGENNPGREFAENLFELAGGDGGGIDRQFRDALRRKGSA
jgi:hypothetical protein